ncbi:hypothetical protein ABZ477_14470 [Microbacterium sp. NPDC019599]|uniref:hypothetical protein n=1 Tax=Microbacterium sp. NPDC019599 TaxID=3154690 RepID=UPI0033CD6EE6
MPKPSSIKLRADPYGKFARASALADFLESIAAHRGSALRTDLELSLKRGGWYRVQRGLFTTDPDIDLANIESLENEDGTEDLDDPDWPDWAMSVLKQRSDVLGPSYPFVVRDDGVDVAADWEHSDYGRLLVLTMAHAYGAVLRVDPRTIFERLIVSAFTSMGLTAVGMGTATTRGRDFASQLQEAATAVGLTAAQVPYPSRTFAKDAGVDAIGVFGWGDRRPGQLVLIAQATLTSSARWEYKITEPKPHHWVGYLQETLHPIGMLAVPHHIEDEHLRFLLSPYATVIDRLRLVGRLGGATEGEDDALAWFVSSELEY